MKTRKSLYPICCAVLLACLSEVAVWGGSSKSQTAAPKEWPEQIGKRKLHPLDFGFIYAGSESSVAKVGKIVRKVLDDLDGQTGKTAAKGLVLVIDKKETLPFQAEDLLTMFARRQSEKEGQDSKKALDALQDGKKEMEELGLDMNLLLSVAPMPIEPNMLPELIKGFPKNMGQQIDWCITIPTESNIKYGMKKMFAAGLKKEKIGIAKQVALFPILAFAENKAIGELKKARQLALYQFIIEKQDHLTDKQKRDKVDAYEKQL
jgi:hypothetical protein